MILLYFNHNLQKNKNQFIQKYFKRGGDRPKSLIHLILICQRREGQKTSLSGRCYEKFFLNYLVSMPACVINTIFSNNNLKNFWCVSAPGRSRFDGYF